MSNYKETPMTDHPKEDSVKTIQVFAALVPSATIKGPVAYLDDGKIRIKRAITIANQIKVTRGEPIAVHFPDNGEWRVLELDWLFRYAKQHPEAKQHASISFDCMMIQRSAIEGLPAIGEKDLETKCKEAVHNARRPELLVITRAMVKVQAAVANALAETYVEIVNGGDTVEDDDEEDDDEG